MIFQYEQIVVIMLQSRCKTRKNQHSRCKTRKNQYSRCKTRKNQHSRCKTRKNQHSRCKTMKNQNSRCKTRKNQYSRCKTRKNQYTTILLQQTLVSYPIYIYYLFVDFRFVPLIYLICLVSYIFIFFFCIRFLLFYKINVSFVSTPSNTGEVFPI